MGMARQPTHKVPDMLLECAIAHGQLIFHVVWSLQRDGPEEGPDRPRARVGHILIPGEDPAQVAVGVQVQR